MKINEPNEGQEALPVKASDLHLVLRLLVALVGAGIGAALTLAVVQLIHLSNPDQELPIIGLALGYSGSALVGSVVFYLISPWVIKGFSGLFRSLVQRLDRMPVTQLVPSIVGLVVGFALAALLSQMLHFIGTSMATTALSAIFYVTLGLLGYTVGWRRSQDLLGLFRHAYTFRAKRVRRKKKKQAVLPEKLVDASALIDGRMAELRETGFLEGELVVPTFIVQELKVIADSADSQKKARGRRGLELLEKLQQDAKHPVRVEDIGAEGETDCDILLLRLARKRGAAIVTCDQTLAKAAAVSGVRALNVNALAAALRPAIAGGDRLQVTIQKEGREPGQGVAYLEDGTMVVVSGARGLMGQQLEAEVTSVLQTSAGRMVFAKVAAA